MTKESIVEWASSWVPDSPPGQRKRFAEALAAELKDWREPVPKPRFCKHCPFAEHYHSPETDAMNGCPGFEHDASKQ